MERHRPLGKPLRELRITESVLREIERTVGSLPAERGGVLGGSREDGLIRYFHFDESARQTGGSYSPNHERLNKLFTEEWNPAGVNLLGFVHSHPPGYRRPSHGDLVYARAILKGIPELSRLFLPIISAKPDHGRFQVFAFAAAREGDEIEIQGMDLVVVEDDKPQKGEKSEVAGKIEIAEGSLAPEPGTPLSLPKPPASHHAAVVRKRRIDTSETFRRVRGAYDLDHLVRCRVIYIGAGGGASFIEDMCRAGVGEHVLIDGDLVSETNLATQQSYRKDIGRAKVDCIADRILDLNPNAVIVARQQSLNEIDDAEFWRLATAPFGSVRPTVTLICGLTDSFPAQARVNRLALQFGLPSLCAQVYQEGRAAEVTFTHASVTTACHRCVLSSRYDAFLRRGFKNDVTSDGTPIFSTTRLNALKGFLSMAILHHGTGHHRWGGFLDRIGNRNLILIRMDPDLQSTLGLKFFDDVFGGGDQRRILCDEVVWLPQKPDCPENGFPSCPDCGGSGNLHDAIGTFSDTRVMRE